MALLADLRMKFLPKCDHLWLIPLQHGNLVEAVAVGTRGGIGVPRKDGFTVNALRITVIRMTGRAFLDDAGLVPFPGRDFVDLLVAVFALDLVDEVDTGVMFRAFLLVATMARHRFRVDLRPFRFEMSLGVRDVPVAAITGKGSMHRLGKLPLNNLVPVTLQAFGIIDALGAVFSSLDRDLVSRLRRLSRKGDPRGPTSLLGNVKLGRPGGRAKKEG